MAEGNGETRERVITTEANVRALERIVEVLHTDIKTQLQQYQSQICDDISEMKTLLKQDHDQHVKNTQSISILNKVTVVIGTGLVSLAVAVIKGLLGY